MIQRANLDVPWSTSDAVGFIAGYFGLVILIPGVLVVLALVIPSLQQLILAWQRNDVTASFGLLLLTDAAAAGLLAVILRRRHATWSDLGLRRFNVGRAVLYLLGGLLAFLLAVQLIEALAKLIVPSFNPNQAQVNEFTQSTAGVKQWLSFVALVVIPPLFEEVIFRGFLFPAFSRIKRLGPVGGAVVVSLLFGLAHWQANVSLYTMVLSLVLCMMYYRLGSLWPGIALHMINNLLAFSVLLHK